ncbi:uncharacterized protein LOC119722251 [Patiria miniata]|uniref:Uncharacterized protein n=1 Tax=Patiria miniata TaxID=46514 RepID=A0A913Z999_PATMI|nr:uncharacterized protein LOC119722251 [Patiria miniata]
MRKVSIRLLLLSTAFLLRKAVCLEDATPPPKRPMLPPPPPPPPNAPPTFRDGANQTTTAFAPTPTTFAPTTDPREPIQELIDTGGFELRIDVQFAWFQPNEVERFKATMGTTCNIYCATKGNCLINPKIADADDVMVYKIQLVSEVKRTAVSFYIKNPYARKELTLTSKQLKKMIVTKRISIEAALGYRLDLGDLDGVVPTEPTKIFPTGPALEWWAITLLAVGGALIPTGAIVIVVLDRRKKRTATEGACGKVWNRKISYRHITEGMINK